MNKKIIRFIKGLKPRGIAMALILVIVMSQITYAGTYTASNLEEYKEGLLKGISDYEDVIRINYAGNERFSETDIGETLESLYNETYQKLSAFDQQNIYSIRMLSAKAAGREEYVLRIAQYEMEYKNSAKDLQELDTIIKGALGQITATCKNDYEEIKAIYDYVLTSYHYEKIAASDTDTANILLERNLLKGLKGSNGVICDAYAMLLSKMLTKQGFENVLVMGTTYPNGLHVWNKVKLNDNWYNIDPTWGDSSKPENKEKYFLTSDAVLLANAHTWNTGEYPSAPNTYVTPTADVEQVEAEKAETQIQGAAENIKVFVDNKEAVLNSTTGVPVLQNNRTLVPIRVISETMGYKVEWNQQEQKVTISKADRNINLIIGNVIAVVNSKDVTMDIGAQVVKNRTYVPLRFISENMGAKVDYRNIGGSQCVYITLAR